MEKSYCVTSFKRNYLQPFLAASQNRFSGIMAASHVYVDKTSDKWTIALLVGTPVVLGVGYLFYRRMSNKTNKSLDGKEDSKSKNDRTTSAGDQRVEKGSAGDKPISAAELPYKKALTHKDEGNTFFKTAKYEEAIQCYTEAIAICPKEKLTDLATFYQNRAAAYEQLKRHDMVIEDCTNALELNCKYIKALQRRAKAYEITKDLQHSMEDLTAACILEQFQNQTTLLSADRVLKLLGRQHAKESMLTRKLIMPSKYFIKTYFSSFAEDPITTNLAHEKESDAAEADLRGYAQAKQAFTLQKYDDVITACTEEIDSAESPNKTEALVLRGTFQLLLGEHALALTDLQTVIDDTDANVKLRVNALIKRASLYMQLEKTSDSLGDFNFAAELDPNNSDVFHHRGQVHLLMEKVNEAMEDFNRAVDLNPDFPIAYVQKCYTDYRHAFSTRNLEKMQDVMNAFANAIKRFPTCSECYTLYAQVLCDQQDYEQADENFQKAIEVEPENATVYVHRGLLQLQWNGDFLKAVDLINQAIKIDERCEFAYETLGTIEVQQGNLKHAVELFDKAIPLAKTELERSHLFSLRDASVTQAKIAERMGISLDNMPSNVS